LNVVIKDVLPNTVVAGNPAKEKFSREDEIGKKHT